MRCPDDSAPPTTTGTFRGLGSRRCHHPLPNNLDHRRRWLNNAHTAVVYLRHATAKPVHDDCMLGGLLRRRGALEGDQPSARRRKRKAPPGEPVQRSHRPSGHHIAGERLDFTTTGGDLLGPAPDNLDRGGQVELRHRLDEEGGATGKRLDQSDREIRPSDSEHEAGQPSTATHVEHRRARRNPLRHRRAVEQMPAPDPRRLPWADESPDHPVGYQQARVRNSQAQPVTEERPGRSGHLRRRCGVHRTRHGAIADRQRPGRRTTRAGRETRRCVVVSHPLSPPAER